MSEKSSAEVIIGGKVYTLSGYEGEEYLQRVSAYINNKINEFDAMEEIRRFPPEMKATLVELNIADDYFKAKKQAEMLEEELAEKDKELYDLKHELIGSQIRLETAEKSVADYQKESTEYQKKIVRLETELKEKNN